MLEFGNVCQTCQEELPSVREPTDLRLGSSQY